MPMFQQTAYTMLNEEDIYAAKILVVNDGRDNVKLMLAISIHPDHTASVPETGAMDSLVKPIQFNKTLRHIRNSATMPPLARLDTLTRSHGDQATVPKIITAVGALPNPSVARPQRNLQ